MPPNRVRAEAKAMLLDPAQAFLARPEYVIREDALLEPALDQVMRNVEFWLNRDPELLRNQLLVQTSNARADILTSDAGVQAMQQLATKRFAQPVIVRKIVEHSGRKASSTEKTLSEIAGMILSGRPSQARDIPAGSFAEVEADYGLLPAPLEKNSRAKGYFSLLRHRENSGGWLNPTGQPSEPVLARCIRELIQKHPDASRLVLQFTVLRRMGQPVEWRYTVEPSATGIRIHATGNARDSKKTNSQPLVGPTRRPSLNRTLANQIASLPDHARPPVAIPTYRISLIRSGISASTYANTANCAIFS